MTKPNTTLRIAPQSDQPTLSKGQQTFNKLVKQIEASRESLARWQAFQLTFEQKVASEHLPILKNLWRLQAKMVHAFDAALGRGGLTKTERRTLQDIVCQMAEYLIVDTDDEEIKAIYNKYSGSDFDAEEAEAVDSMKAAVEEMYGVDAADLADLNSPEDILAHLQEQLEKEEQLRTAEKDKHSTRRKSAKQLAKEEKLKAEEAQTSLSIREVYRKLVSALHPDREPDVTERARKTSLMQRVNQAYKKKDLLQLLELQLELEQIDAKTIANLSDDRLKHFNKILQEQLAELQQEIAFVEWPLRERFGLNPYRAIEPDTVMKSFKREIRDVKNSIKILEQDFYIPGNLAALKLWIKDYKREAKAQARYEDDDLFF
jgi:hypothetical protein